MQINLTVTHTASPELLAVLGGLFKSQPSSNGINGASTVKPAMKPVKAPTGTNDEGEVSLTKIRELATDLSKNQKKGKEVKALLAEFNANALTSLEAAQYPEFFTKLQEL